MKKISIFFVIVYLSIQCMSQHTDIKDEARIGHLAQNILIAKAPLHQKSDFVNANVLSVQLVERNGEGKYFIVNFQPEAYVLISATHHYHPVIAFSFKGNFQYPITAPAVEFWLQQLESKIDYAKQLKTTHPIIQREWELYESMDVISSMQTNEKVLLPMLTTQWNQGMYYNEFCPPDPAGPDKKTYAGCVATAIGQVMNYFRYPLSGEGTYTSSYTTYGTHTVDYDNARYSWNEMPMRLTRSNHPVAQLLYHIGVSVDMNYGPNGSGMWNHKAAHTMKTFFGYTDSTQYNFRDTTNVDWNGMLIDHLDRGIVLYYAGWADSQYVSGHAFVCDGYQDSTFFHFNWGWGGAYDGYFHIDNLIVGGANFTTMHEAVINATPKHNYPYYCQGTDTLRTMDGSIDDGSGPVNNYLNNANCSWLIAPDDTLTNIDIQFIRFDLANMGDELLIYDGPDDTYPLLASYSSLSTPISLQSTGNKVFVVFQTDSDSTSSGFLLSYKANQVKTCSGLTTLTAPYGTITDGSGQYNYQNTNLCRWRIEPPGAGFITIYFSEFDIDTTDVLRITDLTNSSIVANFTGNQIPDTLHLWTEAVMVLFSASATGNAQGFTLHYDASMQQVDELDENQFSLFPNPARNQFFIKTTQAHQSIDVEIYSLDGKIIETMSFAHVHEQVVVSTSHIPRGFYIVKVTSENAYTFSKKLLLMD
jgi:hypothetical protein